MSILQLPQRVEALPHAERRLFERLYHLSTTQGTLRPPEAMRPWIEKHFGKLEAVLQQHILKVTNVITWEGALFNELRSQRPMEARMDSADVQEEIENSRGDPFCRPLEGTPEDSFGRVRGAHSITASNIAKYDGFHGLVIYEEHHPLRFTREAVADYLDTGLAWARRALQIDPQAKYYCFMWNCLWKGGASIIHGHAQVALTRGMHYAKVEGLRQAAISYRQAHGSNYFDDLFRMHYALGLGLERGTTRVMVSLTPIKEKELWLLDGELGPDLKSAIYEALDAYVQRMGVSAFNLFLALPPLVPTEEDWSTFPVLVRLV
ncbi:MAG: hypothetical protein HYZ68_02105, partial [Chloroflexi bacterium]|nr:hypothetical protein [Chloroflexota bacterium]